jgi:hypothetical protein
VFALPYQNRAANSICAEGIGRSMTNDDGAFGSAGKFA